MKECCKTYLDAQFMGDADVVNAIYDEYVTSITAKIGELKTSLAAKDWKQLDRIGHTIKGNALAAGDEDSAQTAIALRSAALLQNEAEVAGLVSKLEELAKLL